MPLLKKITPLALALTLFAGSVPPRLTFADAPGSTPPVELPRTADGKLILNESSLDRVLFSAAGNTDALRAMQSLMRAKDQINLARAALLPSLNLNFIVAMAINPMFMVNSVSCLVPFLFPSNWFNLSAANRTYAAEVIALHVARLNVYAATLTIVTRVAGDEAIVEVMSEQYARLDEYVRALRLQYDLGLIQHGDVLRGEMELGKLRNDLSRVRQLIVDERAALRELLGLRLSQDFVIEIGDLSPSRFEGLSPAAAIDRIVTRAPERRQIDLMIEAARANVRATQWAFLAGCSGSQGSMGAGTGSSVAFNFSVGASVNFGFDYFPKVSLARRNVSELELRHRELELELGRGLETTLGSIREVLGRVEQSGRNLEIAEQLHREQRDLFDLGRVTVKDILDAFSAVSAARAEVLNNRVALSGHRVTLKRMGLEDKFLQIYIESRRQIEIEGRH